MASVYTTAVLDLYVRQYEEYSVKTNSNLKVQINWFTSPLALYTPEFDMFCG